MGGAGTAAATAGMAQHSSVRFLRHKLPQQDAQQHTAAAGLKSTPCSWQSGACASLFLSCSERAETSSSHAKARKELQDMAEAMKVCWCRVL